MKMQDNELDNLFRSNLEGFEMEPSAKVWQNIDAELQTGKRRAIVLMPFLSVAASIIVLVMAGILFIPHNHPVKNGIAKNTPPAKKAIVVPETVKPQVAQATIATNRVNHAARIQSAKKNIATQQQPVVNPTANQPLPGTPPVQQVIADVQQKHDENVQPAKIDTLLIAQNQAPVQTIKPAIIASNVPVTKPAGKKHRIHSFGDMMNVVIAAVDKRKDKFIEFSDTDDDESTITGVNLGIVAVKKQN